MNDKQINFEYISEITEADDSDNISTEGREGAKYSIMKLGSGEKLLLDQQSQHYESWKETVDFAKATRRPVYTESDSKTDELITAVLPTNGIVESISPPRNDGLINVQIIPSHAEYLLNSDHPKLQEFLSVLEDALKTGDEVFIAVDDDTREILAVKKTERENRLRRPDETDENARRETESEFINGFDLKTEVPINEAKLLFEHLSDLANVPYNYPIDCCYARAHEMCRVIREKGYIANKIWNYGRGAYQTPIKYTLKAKTQNVKTCQVSWWYHVAPVLKIKGSNGSAENYVLDPGLFNNIVTVKEWVRTQQDNESKQEYSDDSVYFRTTTNTGNWYDFDYSKTNEKLAEHIVKRNEYWSKNGKPPYPCS